MSAQKKWLSFVLKEDVSFDELLLKIERAFEVKLPCEDDEGRYIAKAKLNNFNIEVVDRVDRLSKELCDENYTLDIISSSEELFSRTFENDIKNILSEGDIRWERFVWAPSAPTD